MKTVEVISEETLYEGRLKGVRETVRYANGNIAKHETILHPGAVVVIPEKTKGKLILIKQYRHSIKKDLYEFPAGTLEIGEAPEVTAKRELEEEINFAAEELTSLGILYPTPGFCNEIQHLFFARKLSAAIRPKDPDEIITPIELSIDEIEKMIASGEIVDGKTLAIFLRARLLKFI